MFPISPFAVHPLVHMITGFTNILFFTLDACFKQGCKEHFCSSVSGGNLWVRDTDVYLFVLYRDQQILYRPQDLIWCPETRAACLTFQL